MESSTCSGHFRPGPSRDFLTGGFGDFALSGGDTYNMQDTHNIAQNPAIFAVSKLCIPATVQMKPTKENNLYFAVTC